MRASGPSGTLRVGYAEAARLGPWVIEQEARIPRAYTFRASVLHEHGYYITQEPLDLVLAVGQTEWLWRDVKLERDGDEVVIALTERPIVETKFSMQEVRR